MAAESAELDRIERFFAALAESPPGQAPESPSGILRLTIAGEDGRRRTWFVHMTGDRVHVERTGQHADCLVEVRPEDFVRVLDGVDHVVSMLLRGDLSVEGELPLLLSFRRLLPPEANSGNPHPLPTAPVAAPEPGDVQIETPSVFHGSLFLTSRHNGDVELDIRAPFGLFLFDTRFLSVWRLTVDGQPLATLSIDDISVAEAKFALVPGRPSHYVNSTTSVLRHRSVGQQHLEEEITLINFAPEPVEYTVRLDIAADFAEVLEIRHGLRAERQVTVTIEDGALHLHYRRQTLHRETVICADQPAELDEHGMTFTVTVAPQDSWTTRLRVLPLVRDLSRRDLRERLRSATREAQATGAREIAEATAAVPRLRADHQGLSEAYERGVQDLLALTYQGLNYWERLPATGLPWSMALLGRESIISSLQAMPFIPERARSTLRILGLSQGVRHDPFRGEEPGKILQESRYGESASFNDTPDAAAFTAVDTTPLFITLLDEYERWTGDVELVRQLEFVARRALEWMDRYADPVGRGYVWSTCRRTRSGVANESWRESIESICFRDGRLATFPQAICEIQGYAYDAKRRAARMARRFWGDPALADRLEEQAAELRERFNRDFWMPERGYYALALQADGTQVDALSSNLGLLLITGIVPPERAEQVVEHLFSPALYSGWGIRTLATTEARFNPLGRYVGVVWPSDTATIAMGLRRYGFRREAGRIARDLLDAAQHFGGRLPALFAGYDRARTRVPVPRPFADSPHAPSAGVPLLLLQALLGLEPYEDHLAIDAAVPTELGQIELLDIRGRWGYSDALGRGRPFGDPPKPQRRRGVTR